MKQQKLIQVSLRNDVGTYGCLCFELDVKQYLIDGWVIVSYQVCPRGGDYGHHVDVVVLLEK